MQKLTAIILASRDINEYDRLYIMYTLEQGLVKAVAKGVRKSTAKLAGHLEPGTLSEVYVARARGTGQITSAIMLDGFENIKNNFEKLGEVLKIFRFFSKNFAEGEKDERIFELLKGLLEILDQPARIPPLAESVAGRGEILIEAFWWKLFDALGQRPEVMKCVNCQKKLAEKTKKVFSVEKGGIVCGGCGSNFAGLALISDNQIKLLRIFWGNPLARIAKVRIREEELGRLGKMRENFEKYSF